MDKAKAVLGATAIVLFANMWVIFGAAATYHRGPIKLPTWESPEIQQCDKELWLRIKDGCNG